MNARDDGLGRTIAALVAALAVTFGCQPADAPPELRGGRGRTPVGPGEPDAGARELRDSGGGQPPRPTTDAGPSICDPTAQWDARTTLAISTLDDDLLGSVTPDELTIAWSTMSGSRARVWWSDRASPTDPFGTPQELPTSFEYAFDRASLSSDGLQLAVLARDRKAILSFFRPTRAIPFERSAQCSGCSSAGFDALNAQATKFETKEVFAGIITLDTATLYYSRIGATREDTAWVSSRTTERDWPLGRLLGDPALARDNGKEKLLTGVSVDQRTVFFLDEGTNTARVGWRAGSDHPLYRVVDLGPVQAAQPNASCARLYFTAHGPASLDIFVGAAR